MEDTTRTRREAFVRTIFLFKTETSLKETSLKMTESPGIGQGQETDGQDPRTRNQDLKIENLGLGTESQGQETGGLDLGTGNLDLGTESLKTVLAQKTGDLDLGIERTGLGPETRRRKTGGRDQDPETDITRNIKRTGLATDVGLAPNQETVNIKVATMTTVRS